MAKVQNQKWTRSRTIRSARTQVAIGERIKNSHFFLERTNRLRVDRSAQLEIATIPTLRFFFFFFFLSLWTREKRTLKSFVRHTLKHFHFLFPIIWSIFTFYVFSLRTYGICFLCPSAYSSTPMCVNGVWFELSRHTFRRNHSDLIKTN